MVGPRKYETLEQLPANLIRVFIEKGSRGVLNVGYNALEAIQGDQDCEVPKSTICSAEQGAVVAWVKEANK